MKKLALALVLVAVPVLAGCNGLQKTYIDADAGRFNAIANDYWTRVKADPAVADADKEIIFRTLVVWRLNLVEGGMKEDAVEALRK